MNIAQSAALLLLFLWPSCSVQDTVVEEEAPVTIDREELLEDIQFLSSDELEGRAPGTEGSHKTQDYITGRFTSTGLGSFGESYRHPFEYASGTGEMSPGVNLIGYVSGTVNDDQYLVVTAHYDHLGVRNGEIYNGADDNASGTAGLIAAAKWFRDHPPANSIIFIALDAEELGLRGARHFVNNPVVPLDQIVMNVNLDMISNNFENELYAVGTYHYEFLKPVISTSVANASIDVLFGYDSPDAGQDWTALSDHYPFHQQGIPFIYFGVEDHEHYHKPSDLFENINPDFYYDAVQVITEFIRDADRSLDEIREWSER